MNNVSDLSVKCWMPVLLMFLLPYPATFPCPSMKRPTNIAPRRTLYTVKCMCKQTVKKPASLQDTRCLQISIDTTVTNRPQRCISKLRLWRMNGANIIYNRKYTRNIWLQKNAFLAQTGIWRIFVWDLGELQQQKVKVILNSIKNNVKN